MNQNSKKMFMAPLYSKEKVTKSVYRLDFYEPNLTPFFRAGQFVNISIPRCKEILWRRPFSVHRVNPEKGYFSVLFDVVGRGTLALKNIQKGDRVNMLGPLGNSFECPDDTEQVILIAGGLGIAPFYLFLQQLEHRDIKKTLFYGAASAERFCCLKEFEQLEATLYLTTDDGSEGEPGLITEPLWRYLETVDLKRKTVLYTCGPTLMLKEVQKISKQFKLPAFVSVENVMACGFGACMGCAVPLDQPSEKRYLLACTDGPVFPVNEIVIDG